MNPVFRWILAAAGVAFLYAFWRATRPRPDFVLDWRDGELRTTHGRPRPLFIRNARDILAAQSIPTGRIEGFRRGSRGVELRFSSSIPAELHQRLRNAYTAA